LVTSAGVAINSIVAGSVTVHQFGFGDVGGRGHQQHRRRQRHRPPVRLG
jgi:hypothetical protein